MQRCWQYALTVLLSVFVSMFAWANDVQPIPALTAPVMDTAHMLQPEQRATLNQQLTAYAREHGSQIVVLTVPTIAPETPFDYSTRVMDSWKLGRQNVDDGVLLLLVRDERKTHLAVGRGLEGAIPDVYAKRILQDVLRPYLQQGQTDAGIEQAVLQIEKLIAGEQLPAASQASDGDDALSAVPILLLLVLVGGGLLKGLFGRVVGSGLTGGLVLVAGLVFGWALLLCLLAAFVACVLTFVLGSQAFIGGGGGSGHWGGGGFGGGLGSGGGFSGGGGGFGGGGASGDW